MSQFLHQLPNSRSAAQLGAVELGALSPSAQGWARFGVALGSAALLGAAALATQKKTRPDWKRGAALGFAGPAAWVGVTLVMGVLFGGTKA